MVLLHPIFPSLQPQTKTHNVVAADSDSTATRSPPHLSPSRTDYSTAASPRFPSICNRAVVPTIPQVTPVDATSSQSHEVSATVAETAAVVFASSSESSSTASSPISAGSSSPCSVKAHRTAILVADDDGKPTSDIVDPDDEKEECAGLAIKDVVELPDADDSSVCFWQRAIAGMVYTFSCMRLFCILLLGSLTSRI